MTLMPFNLRVIIANNEYTLLFADGNREKAEFSLNDKSNRREIDLRFVDGDGKVVASYSGIYRVEKDIMKVCLSKEKGKRPTEFTTRADDKRILNVLKRQQ